LGRGFYSTTCPAFLVHASYFSPAARVRFTCNKRVSCNFENNYKNDPYGILEAEDFGGQPDRLIKCSQDERCPEYAQALFWVAADILSKASSETIDAKIGGFNLTPDMTDDEIMEEISPLLEDFNTPEAPKYDFADPEFKRGLNMMHTAHEAGSFYASTELGNLYLEQGKIQDLERAKSYLNSALNQGDAVSAYNLARIAHMENPYDTITTIKYLRLASSHNRSRFFGYYMVGLEILGNEEEKRTAAQFFKEINHKDYNGEGIDYQWVRQEFNTHFTRP